MSEQLDAIEVDALYRGVLGRPVREDELATALATRRDAVEILRDLQASEEHASRVARRPPVDWILRTALSRDPDAHERAELGGLAPDVLLSRLEADPARRTGEFASADFDEVFRALLGRLPTSGEVDALAHLRSPLRLIRELRGRGIDPRRTAADPPRLNYFAAERARWCHPPGTPSADGDVVVGRDGWLNLVGGSNEVVIQLSGDADELAPGWFDSWLALSAARAERVRRAGARYVWIVAPDKLVAAGSYLVPPFAPSPRRPVERLRAAGVEVVYPDAAFRADPGAFLRTDSHTSLRGDVLLHAAVLAALGEAPHDPLTSAETTERFLCGDLGRRFHPWTGEVYTSVERLGAESVRDDLGGVPPRTFGGNRQSWHNPQAPRPERVLVYGDSFSAWLPPLRTGLAQLLAQTYREVEFAWMPVAWDPSLIDELRPDIVVAEMGERGLARSFDVSAALPA